MCGKALLDVASPIKIQMQVDSGGLDAVMAQMGLDIGDGMAVIEHVYCPAVTKAVYGMDIFETLWGKDFSQVLLADTINAMAGKFLSPLIDKESILIWESWQDAVFSDVELQ